MLFCLSDTGRQGANSASCIVVQDMSWNQKYAWHNRKAMLELFAEAVDDVTRQVPDFTSAVNIHHNYCQCERCKYQVNMTLSSVTPCMTALPSL